MTGFGSAVSLALQGLAGLPVRIEVHAGDVVTVSVAGVDSLDVVLYGEEVTITPAEPAVVPRRSVEPLLSAPRQPVGRSPRDVANA